MAPYRIGLAHVAQVGHPVGPEVAKVSAQLTPGRQHPRRLEEAHGKRPHGALAHRALGVAVVDLHLPFFADGPAQGGQPGFGRRGGHGRHQQPAGVHGQAQMGRQGGADAVERMACSQGQLRVGLMRHPLRAQHQGFDFFLAEHQRRQREAGTQQVAQPGFALDLRALLAQGGDVAVEGAGADLQRVGQHGRAHRPSVAAQGFQQLQQAGGAGGHVSGPQVPGGCAAGVAWPVGSWRHGSR